MDADLLDLPSLLGRTVRVGGLVVDLRPDGVLLDDGTALGVVVLRGAAADLLPLLEPDDAINAVGRVEQTVDGAVVVVDDPGGVVQAGDPVAPAIGTAGGDGSIEQASAAETVPAGESQPASQQASLVDGQTGIGAGLAGLGTLVALSLLSLAITVGRRTYARRRLEARIAARVVAFGASGGPPHGARSAERDDNSFHSA
jgi:hypothetical protein